VKRYKSTGTDQILAKLMQAGGKTICSEIHKLNTREMEGIYYCTYLQKE
jgi:hypothetical protein